MARITHWAGYRHDRGYKGNDRGRTGAWPISHPWEIRARLVRRNRGRIHHTRRKFAGPVQTLHAIHDRGYYKGMARKNKTIEE